MPKLCIKKCIFIQYNTLNTLYCILIIRYFEPKYGKIFTIVKIMVTILCDPKFVRWVCRGLSPSNGESRVLSRFGEDFAARESLLISAAQLPNIAASCERSNMAYGTKNPWKILWKPKNIGKKTIFVKLNTFFSMRLIIYNRYFGLRILEKNSGFL